LTENVAFSSLAPRNERTASIAERQGNAQQVCEVLGLRQAVDEYFEFAGREFGPVLVGGQRRGDDDGDAVVRRRDLGKVDRQVLVGQACGVEGIAAHHVAQLGRAVRVQRGAV